MDLKAAIQNEIKDAMKQRDTVKVDSLRMLMAEIKKREIDKRGPLDDAEIQKAIGTLVKQHQESIEAFEKGAREDLAQKERRELNILQAYLPKQMTRSEIETLVVDIISETEAKGAGDIGKVMKAVLAKARGRADGKTINEIAQAKLSQ